MKRDEHSVIRVLKADPDLVRFLEPEVAEFAQRHTIAPCVSLAVGTADRLSDMAEDPDRILGYLVVRGMLIHRVAIGLRTGVELLGEGDMIIPRSRENIPLQHAVQADDSWEILEPVQLAVLDTDFQRTVIRWPGIMAQLFDRAGQRACTLAFYLALGQVVGTERRLLVLLWLLADRWGTVTPEGVEIPLRLSHKVLGDLVGARRPTVTTTLKALADQGHITPRDPAGWILKGDPPERLGAIGLSAEAEARAKARAAALHGLT